MLSVQLLEDFRLAYRGKPVTSVDTPRLVTLLAYLILHREAPQSRQRLSFLFWPDSDEHQARTNLRQLLHHLRRALPDPDRFLWSGASTLQWRPDGPFTLDVAEFEEALETAREAGANSDGTGLRAALERAVALYAGDLLPGCYDEWVEPKRAELREAFRAALDRLVALLEGERDYLAAVRHAERLMAQDPLSETSCLTLMRLHALNGNRAGALRAYDRSAATLRRELGVEPGLPVQAARERLIRSDGEQGAPALDPAVPLVGRLREWEQLRAAWSRACRGRAQLLLISGEAGVGKTRLAEELLNWAGRQGIAAARSRSYAAEGGLAYGPVVEWLRAGPIRAALSRVDPVWLGEIARVLPELRARRQGHANAEPLSDAGQRRRLFEGLARGLLARGQPLLLLLDDLQWCDQQTLEWLHFMLRFAPAAPVLVLGTVRSEEVPRDHALMRLVRDLGHQRRLEELNLEPLDEAETARLARLAAGREVEEDLTTRLFRETEGNPLFVVEGVRAGMLGDRAKRAEAAASSALLQAPPSLPPTVYAVISARLARLSPQARGLASLAATIGRVFTLEVLAAASDWSDERIALALEELCARQVVREQRDGFYDFTHDKLREVAYSETSGAARRLLHRRAAGALEAVHASEPDSVIGQVAAHYDKAGLLLPALQRYRRAAELARRVYAYPEAASHIRRSLALLEQLPRGADREALERDLQMDLALSLVPLEGYGADSVQAAWSRVLALSRSLGELPPPPVVRTMALGSLATGELARAGQLSAALLRQVESANDSIVEVEAHYLLGVLHFWQGHFGKGRDHLERSLALYDGRQQHRHLTLYGQHPEVVCRVRLALCLWFLGRPDEAREQSERSLAQAMDLAHPLTTVYALTYASWLSSELADRRTVEEQTGRAIGIARECGLRFWHATNSAVMGWVRAQQGEVGAGVAQIRQGIAEQQAMRQPLHLPYAFVLLARALRLTEDGSVALSPLAEAEGLMAGTGIDFLRSEVQRLRGELLMARPGAQPKAEASLRRALEIADGQGAASLALRAAVQLTRLSARRGPTSEACGRLGEVCASFREGSDTADLQEAKALLDELR